MKTHYVTNNISVYIDYAIKLAEHPTDKNVRLLRAPTTTMAELIYLTSNGDDTIVGWLDDDVIEVDDFSPILLSEESEWIREALAKFRVSVIDPESELPKFLSEF